MRDRFAGTIYSFVLLLSLAAQAQTVCPLSTYFGGSQSDEVKSVVNDPLRNTYVFGNTYSADLPVTTGLINDSYSGSYDAFLAKFDSCGLLLWCTYLGGANFDSAEKMAWSGDGNLVLCGYTASLNTFTSTACLQPAHGGGYDAFVCKVDPGGNLVWSTLFGKAGGDFAYDICVDPLNNILVGGTTSSTGLYTVPGISFQLNLKGNTDAFIARFSPTGAFRWCTYYGGNNSEDIHVVTSDAGCHVIGAGGSFSTNLNTSNGAFQSLNDGGSDGYVIKLDSNGTRVFSSYFGGSGIDDIWGVTCDTASNIYLAGHTNSSDFDVITGAYQASVKGLSDLYLTKWSPSGTLLSSTLFGGSHNELLGRMTLSAPDEVTLAGKTESADIPLLGAAFQHTLAGAYDIVLAKFDTHNLFPVWSSYYGGSQDEELFDLAGLNGRYLTVSGSTNSSDFPLSAAPYQPVLNSNSVDGFVTRLAIGKQVSTGIAQLTGSAAGPMVFPNPFDDCIQVRAQGLQALTLYDALGRDCTASVRGTDAKLLHTGALPPGLYWLVISDASGIHGFRLCH